jgi:hypothetical protein
MSFGMSFHFFTLDFFIFFATSKSSNECLRSIIIESKQEDDIIEKRKRKKRGKGKRIVKS